jgi:hypothetical protein
LRNCINVELSPRGILRIGVRAITRRGRLKIERARPAGIESASRFFGRIFALGRVVEKQSPAPKLTTDG